MKLRELLASLDASEIISNSAYPGTEINRITDDSREAGPCVLFVATEQGASFADEAKAAGAIVLFPENLVGSPHLRLRDAVKSMGEMASTLYGSPSQSLRVVGVTGTNGKTSITWMMYHLWKESGVPAGLIGTLGVRYTSGGTEILEKTGYTTPRSYQIHELLHRMRQAGVKRVAMEVSSEALALGRLHGVSFSVAAFTNLSRDHLNFHKTMDNYFESKALLFRQTAATGGRLIVYLPEEGDSESLGYAKRMADLAKELLPTTEILRRPLNAHLAASFQRINAAVAVEGAGMDPGERAHYASLVERVPSVPGRFEMFSLDSIAHPGSAAIVDYAHSPDALGAILKEARSSADKVICVCGCGGNRDAGKRPIMARVASELSDVLIITDDNPRKEDPGLIRRQMREGIPRATRCVVHEIGDRREAICAAIRMSIDSDVRTYVVIAGKGHETVQILADRTEPFSDQVEVRKAIGGLEKKENA